MKIPLIRRTQLKATRDSGRENPLEFLYIKSSLPYLKHQLKDPIPSFKVHFSKPIGIAVRIERDILKVARRRDLDSS